MKARLEVTSEVTLHCSHRWRLRVEQRGDGPPLQRDYELDEYPSHRERSRLVAKATAEFDEYRAHRAAS